MMSTELVISLPLHTITNEAHICDYTLNIGDAKLNRAYLAEENASIHAHNLINTILEL